jgi:hypothetical protein
MRLGIRQPRRARWVGGMVLALLGLVTGAPTGPTSRLRATPWRPRWHRWVPRRDETVTFTGRFGIYRYLVTAVSASGDYTLGYKRP